MGIVDAQKGQPWRHFGESQMAEAARLVFAAISAAIIRPKPTEARSMLFIPDT